MLRTPTRSASSRWNRARRWRRCRGSSPTCFYDLVVEVAIIRPGPIVGQMVHPVSEPARGPRAGALPASVARADSRADARRAAVSGTAAADGDGRRGLHRRAGRGAAARVRVQAIRAADESRSRCSCARGWRGRASPARPPSRSSRRSPRSRSTAFPSRTRRASRCSAYASAYLKAHYPAAFYTALLNNQPMGFYHPSTLVKDAQRRGVRFHPIDVQVSDWDCTVERDGAIRLGLRYVNGPARAGRPRDLQRDRGSAKRMERAGFTSVRYVRSVAATTPSMHRARPSRGCFCNVCSHEWLVRRLSAEAATREGGKPNGRSCDDRVARRARRARGLRRDEVVTLADIGALNAFGYDRPVRAVAGRARASGQEWRVRSSRRARAGRAGEAGRAGDAGRTVEFGRF